jgi:hypothetical protein
MSTPLTPTTSPNPFANLGYDILGDEADETSHLLQWYDQRVSAVSQFEERSSKIFSQDKDKIWLEFCFAGECIAVPCFYKLLAQCLQFLQIRDPKRLYLPMSLNASTMSINWTASPSSYRLPCKPLIESQTSHFANIRKFCSVHNQFFRQDIAI